MFGRVVDGHRVINCPPDPNSQLRVELARELEHSAGFVDEPTQPTRTPLSFELSESSIGVRQHGDAMAGVGELLW